MKKPEIDTDIFDAKFRCRSCRKIWDFELFVNLAVPKYFSYQDYRSIKDGGGPVFFPCPECNLETYVLEEDKCIVCGESVNWHCWRCGQSIPLRKWREMIYAHFVGT